MASPEELLERAARSGWNAPVRPALQAGQIARAQRFERVLFPGVRTQHEVERRGGAERWPGGWHPAVGRGFVHSGQKIECDDA